MELLSQISENVQSGDDKMAREFTKKAIAENITPKKILDDALIGAMNIVGEQFKNHEIFLPDVLLSAKAMTISLDELKPLLSKSENSFSEKIVIGTVKGDLHDIGKNLVAIMLQGAGFEIIDLGNDVPPEKFVETARKENARVIGMSALLTTTMTAMNDVTTLLKKENLAESVKTIIGGAPVSKEYAAEIGADAYGFDGVNAVSKIKALMGV